jgi:hypothetical protein
VCASRRMAIDGDRFCPSCGHQAPQVYVLTSSRHALTVGGRPPPATSTRPPQGPDMVRVDPATATGRRAVGVRKTGVGAVEGRP